MKIYLRKISHPLLSNLRALSRVSLINSRSLPSAQTFSLNAHKTQRRLTQTWSWRLRHNPSRNKLDRREIILAPHDWNAISSQLFRAKRFINIDEPDKKWSAQGRRDKLGQFRQYFSRTWVTRQLLQFWRYHHILNVLLLRIKIKTSSGEGFLPLRK
jgi:hypothetical protein